MNRDNPNLKIGLIGCGKVAGEHHLPSLMRIPAARVIALADPEHPKMSSLSRKYHITKQYRTETELLADKEIEAVGILTDTPSHCDIAVAALKAGKHVFLEKPLALSRSECDRLVEACRSTGKTNMVCFNLRWHRLIEDARRFIRSGRLGDIKIIRSSYTHFRDGADAPDWHRKLCRGGGVTFNESVHHFDLWRFLLGQNIEEVHAFQTRSAHYEDETSVIGARLSGGTLGTIINTFKTSPTSELELLGVGGRLHINLYQFDGMKFFPHLVYPGSIIHRAKNVCQSISHLPRVIPALSKGGIFGETFYRAWSHFVQSALLNKQTTCTFEDGQQAVLTTLAAVKSFSDRSTVLVNQSNELPGC